MAPARAAIAPVELPAASDVVVDHVRRAIELGALIPGDRLPAERELATQLNISRVTVREALRALEADRLIKLGRRGPGGGALVVGPADIELLRASLRERRDELISVMEFRLVCESAAAGFAAQRRTGGELELLERSIDELSTSSEVGPFRAADAKFHLGIAEATGNAMLQRSVEDARAAMFTVFDALPYELLVESSVNDHRRILSAIAAGRPDLARNAMTRHLQRAQTEVLTILDVRRT